MRRAGLLLALLTLATPFVSLITPFSVEAPAGAEAWAVLPGELGRTSAARDPKKRGKAARKSKKASRGPSHRACGDGLLAAVRTFCCGAPVTVHDAAQPSQPTPEPPSDLTPLNVSPPPPAADDAPCPVDAEARVAADGAAAHPEACGDDVPASGEESGDGSDEITSRRSSSSYGSSADASPAAATDDGDSCGVAAEDDVCGGAPRPSSPEAAIEWGARAPVDWAREFEAADEDEGGCSGPDDDACRGALGSPEAAIEWGAPPAVNWDDEFDAAEDDTPRAQRTRW
ncbi:MAG: hypothetical protein J3K34DRAFT_44987 [Monoraphidium minutum]|nr:MAG: hypothetical protein J3K34DRAFT_44987 [Monoraphidium minutum]